MAGFVTKGNHIYDGEHLAAVDLTNGTFVYIDSANKAAPLTQAVDMTVRVKELEGPFGMPGLRLTVVKQGVAEVFLVENVPATESTGVYDETTFGPKAGEYARIHRPLAGEELLVSVASNLLAGVVVGDVIIVGNSAGALPFSG